MSEMNEQTVGGEPEDGKFLSEEYGIGGPPAAIESPPTIVDSGKSPDILAAEIRTIKTQTGRMVLNASIEVGRRLTEAKAKLPHGKWGEYLKQEVDYSPSQAQNLMRVFREYGSDQQSLFGGEAKSQTFGNLTFSKALSLLAIPDEEERARFVEENDVENMSTRELNEALKARDEAEEAAIAAQDEADRLRKETDQLKEQLNDQARTYEARLTSAGVETDQARAEAKAAKEAQEKAAERAQRLQNALSEANTSAQAAEDEHTRLVQELEELRNQAAGADPEAVEAARKAAIDEMTEKVNKAKDARKQADEKRKAAEDALAAAQNELAELKAKEPEVRELTQEEKDALTAEAVEKARAEGAEQIRNLEKKLAATDPDVVEFKVLFTNWQLDFRKIKDALGRLTRTNEEQASKLAEAVEAALKQMTRH